jgi:hypothetical protein
LQPCIDGSERIKEGTFIGFRINDAPGVGTYDPDKRAPRRKGDAGGYWPYGQRTAFGKDTGAPSPDKYANPPDMLKPSLNVTYSTSKL